MKPMKVDFKGPGFLDVHYLRLTKPFIFQSKKGFNVTATYLLDGDRVKVINTEYYFVGEKIHKHSIVGHATPCKNDDGTEIEGVAHVQFFGPNNEHCSGLSDDGNYQVILKTPSYMLIIGKTDKYAWLMTRSPDSDLNEAIEAMEKLGFKLTDFQPIGHYPKSRYNLLKDVPHGDINESTCDIL